MRIRQVVTASLLVSNSSSSGPVPFGFQFLGGSNPGRSSQAAQLIAAVAGAHAASLELDGCHDDLDRVRRTASDASDAAEEAETKRGDLEDCDRDSELHNGCRSQRSDYEVALSDLESKMDDLDSRLRSVQTSCGYEFSINRMSAGEASQRQLEASRRRLEDSRRRLCTSLRDLVGLGITPSNALQRCKASADEQWCKACLGLK
jgi:chromosome segregation ATPase